MLLTSLLLTEKNLTNRSMGAASTYLWA